MVATEHVEISLATLDRNTCSFLIGAVQSQQLTLQLSDAGLALLILFAEPTCDAVLERRRGRSLSPLIQRRRAGGATLWPPQAEKGRDNGGAIGCASRASKVGYVHVFSSMCIANNPFSIRSRSCWRFTFLLG